MTNNTALLYLYVAMGAAGPAGTGYVAVRTVCYVAVYSVGMCSSVHL